MSGTPARGRDRRRGRGWPPGWAASLVVLAGAAVVLTSCNGSGNVSSSRSPNLSGPPSRSAESSPPAGRTTTREPSRSESQAPPQTETQTQTRIQTQTQTENRTDTQTQIQTATQTATQTQTARAAGGATPTPTSIQATGGAAPGNGSSSIPAWVWWLVAAVALACVVAIVLVSRKRSRKRAWADRFAAARREVAQFTRELIPRLAQAPTAQQMAGGWRIETDRVVAIEDHLTTLEATAVDDLGRTHAHTLRDAVRESRTRLATLDTAPDTIAAMNLLRSVAAELEAALSAADPAAPTPTAGAARG